MGMICQCKMLAYSGQPLLSRLSLLFCLWKIVKELCHKAVAILGAIPLAGAWYLACLDPKRQVLVLQIELWFSQAFYYTSHCLVLYFLGPFCLQIPPENS